MHLDLIKGILEDHTEAADLFKRNLVKEYLQVLTLSFIYKHPDYQNLIFYGGSCLRHCYNLPRLSEDLDFVDIKGKVDLEELTFGLKRFFEREMDIKIKTKIQKFRIYLKFPILYELKLAEPSETDFLFIKVEIFSNFQFCKNYKIETLPIFKFGQSLLVKTFDLPTLMATKIRAVFHRRWEKTNKKGKVLAKVKGRDYFDLMWYLEKGILPNLKCLEGISNLKDLKEKLLKIIEKADRQSIEFDLEGLIEDRQLSKGLAKEIKAVLNREIEKIET